MQETIMSREVCMQFLIWSYYYHDIMPERNKSFSHYKCFSDEDTLRLDHLKEALFACFTEESIHNACKQFEMAKKTHEACPFTQQSLDNMFARKVDDTSNMVNR